MIFAAIFAVARWTAIFALLHPIHISVTEIEFDEKEKALEIMMRVFIDDLEVSFKNRFNKPDLDIFDPANSEQVDRMMAEYLKDHFRVSLDDKTTTFKYLGHEQETDVFIFYIEVSNVRKWRKIDVKNSIIMETYDDQSNLVHVAVGESIRSLRLTRDAPSGSLSFANK